MKTIPLRPERQAALEEFARRRGKTPADVLDDAFASLTEFPEQCPIALENTRFPF